jgi:hypothetical protein
MTRPLVNSTQHHEYRGLLVTRTVNGVAFAFPADPAKIIAVARVRRTGHTDQLSAWVLRIPGHTWPVDSHPLNMIPGDKKIVAVQFKGFATWQQCAREIIEVFHVVALRSYDSFKDPIGVGMVLSMWHNTGAMGAQLCYARVIKLGKSKIQVQVETTHRVSWQYPHHFRKIVGAQELADLRADGFDV